MELTKGQVQGLEIALDRYAKNKKYTVISGCAGVGKSTLVRFIVDAIEDKFGVSEDDVVYTSFTGKATQVLSRKGNKNTLTLHKLLYESFPRPDGTFYRIPRMELGYHIVVVDECSMAPMSLVEMLLSHRGVYTIFCGDPFQLPPISKNEDNHLLDEPDIFLDEITRQEEGSEIIQLTMKIRNHESIPYMQGNEVQVLPQDSLSTGMLTWANQILTATNKSRKEVNQTMRKLQGFEDENPMEGDKVVCLRNYWGFLSDDQNDLINGTIGYLQHPFQLKHYLPARMGGKSIAVTEAGFVSDIGEDFGDIQMDTHMILTGDKCVDAATAYKLSKSPKTKHIIPYEFTYGYAITAHRAQGSEWDKVLVLEEGFPFNEEEHARWLYTACTRAIDRLVLLR